MELQIHINGGNRCDVRFEHHHKFKRVITLLRSNKIIPETVNEDQIGIVDQTGKNYDKDDLVKNCMKENNTGQINIVFDVNGSSGQSKISSEVPHAQRVLGVIRSFFQYMERRKFKKLENYWNHNEAIFRQVARFGKIYERLYIYQLFWKNGIADLKPDQQKQLKQYQEKHKTQFDRIERQKKNWLDNNMKHDKELIEYQQQEIKQLKSKLKENNQKQGSLSQEVQLLKKQCQSFKENLQEKDETIAELKQNLQEKYETIAELKEQLETKVHNLTFQLDKNLQEVSASYSELSKARENIKQLQQTNSSLENQLKKEKKQYKSIKAKLSKLQQQLLAVQTQKIKVEQNLNELQERNELINLDASLSLAVKIKKKQSIIDPHLEQSLLCRLIDCSADVIDQMIREMDQEGKQVTYEMVYEWPAGEKMSVWDISRKIYSGNNENILLICKTKLGQIVGGYSTIDSDSRQFSKQKQTAFLFSYSSTESKLNTFSLKKNHSPLTYDKQFLVFGDEDLALDYEDKTLTCRLASNLAEDELSYEKTDSRKANSLERYNFFGDRYQSFAELEWYCLISCKFE